ncbi:MAG: hypothetical protein KME16_15985 [Scytolyngbya sp. HA4215-MV1]|jgi:hypothetical protein|nr:hypothetical protein [Scytolyngbya sp. HA4215-MV1]
MMRLKFGSLLAVLLVVGLGACNNPSPSQSEATASPEATATTEASPVASASPTTTANDTQKVLTEMQAVLAQTKAAVQANDFKKAQAVYADFDEKYWEKIEDGVKEKSKASYKQVEEGMVAISNQLKAPKPDATKTIAAIDALTKTLNAYAKGS